MTRSVPAGSAWTRAAMRARSRRLVRLRTTAPPTALETTKPTRGGCPARASAWLAWTTINVEPARAPLGPRKVAAKSALARSRCPAGSTGSSSGGELGAALGAAGRQDGATRTGAHAQAEAVGLGPTTVVRLESTLAHEDLRYWSGPGGLLSAWAPVRPQSEARASTTGGTHRGSRGVTGMRKRPTGLVKGTRARRAGSNQRRPPGIPGAFSTSDPGWTGGHAVPSPRFCSVQANFRSFRLPSPHRCCYRPSSSHFLPTGCG